MVKWLGVWKIDGQVVGWLEPVGEVDFLTYSSAAVTASLHISFLFDLSFLLFCIVFGWAKTPFLFLLLSIFCWAKAHFIILVLLCFLLGQSPFFLFFIL